MKTAPTHPHDTQARRSQATALQRAADHEAPTAMARQLQASPRLSLQRRAIDAMFGATAQRAGPEEDMLQGRFAATAQRAGPEEELPAQGRFAATPVQRVGGMEEEMPAQGRFMTAAQAKEESAAQAPAPNRTGMPDGLKSGIESLSGMDMSDVRVHRNSSEPAQLNALAYAQGNDVHLGPGQEQHLPHEAWHVVQQRQGRVAPTLQMAGVPVNDDAGLEQEADVMGAKALQTKRV
jgi:hypothetical protein